MAQNTRPSQHTQAKGELWLPETASGEFGPELLWVQVRQFMHDLRKRFYVTWGPQLETHGGGVACSDMNGSR